jgi:hypothetical protein
MTTTYYELSNVVLLNYDTFESYTNTTDCSCSYCTMDKDFCLDLKEAIEEALVEALLCAPFFVTDSFAG